MIRLIAHRLLWAFPVALGVVSITFFTARLFGGDPTELYAPPEATDELRVLIRERLGLADPLWIQYLRYLGDVVRFDFGVSFSTNQPVAQDLTERLPATLELGLTGLSFGALLGIPLGVFAAVRRERVPDFLVRGLTLTGMALPQFWIGLVLIWIFFVILGWFPGPVGRLPIDVQPPQPITGFMLIDLALMREWATWRLAAWHLVLPATTLAIATLAPIARVTRASMVEALQSDYIRTAVAMGHGQRVLWFRYALRNALLPVVTLIGVLVGNVLGGAVLLESVFGWPGLGQYALQSIEGSDFAALQGFVIYAALLYVVTFLIVDILYIVIDPRMRTA